MPPKKAKGKGKEAPPPAKTAMGPPPKPKKPPPPPACFGPEDLAKFKEMFKAYDEENIDKVTSRFVQVKIVLKSAPAERCPLLDKAFLKDAHNSVVKLEAIPLMLRKLGFNPKGDEIKQLFAQFLEDEYVDTVEYHEWLFMIEAKMNWGDDFELAVCKAFAALGQDEAETGIVDLELLRQELMSWGEPLVEIEFVDWIRLAIKDKVYNPEDGTFCYTKFVENMNNKDEKYIKEPINFFKLDQKTLAEMAMKKAQEEKEEQERKDAEKRARDEAKRQKMIADGLIPPD